MNLKNQKTLKTHLNQSAEKGEKYLENNKRKTTHYTQDNGPNNKDFSSETTNGRDSGRTYL